MQLMQLSCFSKLSFLYAPPPGAGVPHGIESFSWLRRELTTLPILGRPSSIQRMARQ